MVWQEGGPGISSLFSLFNQHGPFVLDEALTLMPRNYSWTKIINMLYIDAPTGAGESVTRWFMVLSGEDYRDADAKTRACLKSATEHIKKRRGY